MGEPEIQSIVTEIEIMEKIDHPNVVKLYDLKEDDEYLYMVLEFMAGGSLRDRLLEEKKKHKKLSEEEIFGIIAPIVDAMEYCHENGVVHRDLKVASAHTAGKHPLRESAL